MTNKIFKTKGITLYLKADLLIIIFLIKKNMMKKITLFLMTLVAFSLNAQVYYLEDFEAETVDTEPVGMTVYNEDACTVNNSATFPNEAWMVLDNGDAQGQFAGAQSWTVPTCQVDDWLVTPAIDLTTATANTDLSWVAQSFEGPNFPEDYEVLISTTGNAVADFTTVLLAVNGELEDWTSHTVSLAPYIGNTVYIAFRLISTDQSQLWVDDIQVSEPAQFDAAISAVNTNGTIVTTPFSAGQFLVVDFVDRTSFDASIDVTNVGVQAIDSLYLTYFLVDDLNAPTAGVAFGDTVFIAGGIAPGASYNHAFESFGIDTLFPGLGPDQLLDFYVQIDSSSWNLTSNDADFNYNGLVAPAESYMAPYQTSFEVADLNAGVFLFDHVTWGWKYFDNDADGASIVVSNDFTNLPAQDGSMQAYASIIGSQLSLAAEDETMQSPNLSLTSGTAYNFSIYARTGFGVTGSIDIELETVAGAYANTLGTINLAAGDSAYTKYDFSVIAPSTQEDYVINFNKNATGFLVMDLFEMVELQQPTATISLSASSTDEPGVEYCDSTVSVTFSTTGNPSSVTLDWGDGTVDDVTGTSSATHTYSAFGTYTIQVTATNIVGSSSDDTSLDFTAPPAPTVTVTQPTINSMDASFTIGNSVGSNIVYTPECSRIIVDWGDGTVDEVTGQNSAAHSYTAGGTYTVTVTVIGTGQATETIEVVITTNINEVNFANALSIYPNPASNVVAVDFGLLSNQDVEISTYAVDGKLIDMQAFTNVKDVNTTFNTSSYENGVYLLKIKANDAVTTQRFVVNHQ